MLFVKIMADQTKIAVILYSAFSSIRQNIVNVFIVSKCLMHGLFSKMFPASLLFYFFFIFGFLQYNNRRTHHRPGVTNPAPEGPPTVPVEFRLNLLQLTCLEVSRNHEDLN